MFTTLNFFSSKTWKGSFISLPELLRLDAVNYFVLMLLGGAVQNKHWHGLGVLLDSGKLCKHQYKPVMKDGMINNEIG